MDCFIKTELTFSNITNASVHSLRSLGQAYGRISLRSKAAPINLPSMRGVSVGPPNIKWRPHLIAFLISPLSLIPFALIMVIPVAIIEGVFTFDDFWFLSAITLTAILIGYIALLVFGLPIVILLQLLDYLKYIIVVPLSLVAASIVWAIYPFDGVVMPLLFYSSGLIVSVSYKWIFDKANPY